MKYVVYSIGMTIAAASTSCAFAQETPSAIAKQMITIDQCQASVNTIIQERDSADAHSNWLVRQKQDMMTQSNQDQQHIASLNSQLAELNDKLKEAEKELADLKKPNESKANPDGNGK